MTDPEWELEVIERVSDRACSSRRSLNQKRILEHIERSPKFIGVIHPLCQMFVVSGTLVK